MIKLFDVCDEWCSSDSGLPAGSSPGSGDPVGPLLFSPHWLSLFLIPFELPRLHVITASWVCLGRGEGLTFGLAHMQGFFLRFWTGSLFGLGLEWRHYGLGPGIFVSQKGYPVSLFRSPQ